MLSFIDFLIPNGGRSPEASHVLVPNLFSISSRLQHNQASLASYRQVGGRGAQQALYFHFTLVNNGITKRAAGNIRDDNVGKFIRHAAFFPVAGAVPVRLSAGGAAFPGGGLLGLSTKAAERKEGDDCNGLFHAVRV